MNISEALKEYEKAQKENSKAQAAAKAAADHARELWQAIPRESLLKFKHESPEYIAAKEASEAETKARKEANFTKAVYIAESDNILNVLSNVIKTAIQEHPEKYNKPVYYKVFKNNIAELLPENFYVYSSYTSLYIRHMYADGVQEKYICNLESENGCIKFDSQLENRQHESTLKEIKKEAKQAIKDAEKLQKAIAKLKATDEGIKNNYKSYVKYIMPSLNYSLIEDKYNLF